MKVILIMLLGVALLGWLHCWVGIAALAKYITDKGYTPPSDEELKACSTYVLKKLLHIR